MIVLLKNGKVKIGNGTYTYTGDTKEVVKSFNSVKELEEYNAST